MFGDCHLLRPIHPTHNYSPCLTYVLQMNKYESRIFSNIYLMLSFFTQLILFNLFIQLAPYSPKEPLLMLFNLRTSHELIYIQRTRIFSNIRINVLILLNLLWFNLLILLLIHPTNLRASHEYIYKRQELLVLVLVLILLILS